MEGMCGITEIRLNVSVEEMAGESCALTRIGQCVRDSTGDGSGILTEDGAWPTDGRHGQS